MPGSGKLLLPAVIKSDETTEQIAVIEYEKADSDHYTFFCKFNNDYSFRMDETEETADQTSFVDAEFEKDISDSDKIYYSAAASSGIITGLLSTVHLSEELLDKTEEFKEKDWKPFIIKAARCAGYKKNDYKGASEFLVRRVVHTIDKKDKTKEYLTVLAENPSLAGLVFSMVTQYCGEIVILSETGKISKRKLPSYYVIGDTDAEKIICAVFYWLFALGAEEVRNKLEEVGLPGVSKELLKKIKEFSDFPFMRNIPLNYEETEESFSKWLKKTLNGMEKNSEDKSSRNANPLFVMMNIALDLAEESLPVLINECIVRSMYVLIHVCSVVKALKVRSFKELAEIPLSEMLPSNERLISKMYMIASATFSGVNIAGATLKAVKEKKVNGKKFSDTFISELNVVGIGRFLFACVEDSKYWGEDIKVLFQRKKRVKPSEKDTNQRIENNKAFDSLRLEPIPARILYSLESLSVRYDIQHTKKKDDAESKQLWLNTWKESILLGVGVMPEFAAQYFLEDEDILYDGIYKLTKEKDSSKWFYLLTQELSLFTPYYSLGHVKDKAFKKLKIETDYIKDQFVRRQTVVSQEDVDSIKKIYSRYKGYVSGSTQNKIKGAGVVAVATVATGGFALTFAPGIAAAIAGEAVVGLHGAALTSASLAFVGGGSLAAGGLGMAGGTAIITGGGALIGLASSGSVSVAAIMLQTPGDYWIRQSSKLLTLCNYILIHILNDKASVRAILKELELTINDSEQELNTIKLEKNDLDKELIKKMGKYHQYLKKCSKELRKISKE